MRKAFDNIFTEQFAEGAARAAFVQAWAQKQEEKGKQFPPGVDVMDKAPATPLSAWVWAGELMGRLAELNKASIHMLGAAAAKADGVDWVGEFDGNEFGHYIAMEALDTGASWFDDHAKFPLKVPYMEYDYFGR